jgi:glutamate--cysteine ligase catalytic subunit
MNRAQERDAVHRQKFYFRKDVFPTGRSKDFPFTEPMPGATTQSVPCGEAQNTATPRPCSETKVNGTSPPHAHPKKEKALRNCYPDVQPVTLERKPVEEEYEEMSINEIINGKVGEF